VYSLLDAYGLTPDAYGLTLDADSFSVLSSRASGIQVQVYSLLDAYSFTLDAYSFSQTSVLSSIRTELESNGCSAESFRHRGVVSRRHRGAFVSIEVCSFRQYRGVQRLSA
jgi:hypothetical protein